MITYYAPEEIPQGSKKWHEVRNGLLTGTDAYDILQGKDLDYILKVKNSSTFTGNYYTRRGHILENEAREIYSETIQPVRTMGFIVNDKYPKCGFSPDGLILKENCKSVYDGLWECKAFNEKRHLKVYESLDDHVLAQIQFGLMITELSWCDLTLYNPDIEDIENVFLVKRVYADKTIQNRLKSLLT